MSRKLTHPVAHPVIRTATNTGRSRTATAFYPHDYSRCVSRDSSLSKFPLRYKTESDSLKQLHSDFSLPCLIEEIIPPNGSSPMHQSRGIPYVRSTNHNTASRHSLDPRIWLNEATLQQFHRGGGTAAEPVVAQVKANGNAPTVEFASRRMLLRFDHFGRDKEAAADCSPCRFRSSQPGTTATPVDRCQLCVRRLPHREDVSAPRTTLDLANVKPGPVFTQRYRWHVTEASISTALSRLPAP